MIKRRYRRFLLIIVALAIPIIPFAIIGELPGETWLSSKDDNALLFAVTGASLLTLDILLPLPSSIVGTLLAARLGLFAGFATILAGLFVGHLAGYALGRFGLRRFDAEFPTVPTLLIVFLSRPVPVLAEAVAIAAGAGSMPLAPCVAALLAGDAVYAAVLAANGASLLPDDLMGIGLVLPMLLPVVAWLVWRWVGRGHRGSGAP